MASGLDNSSLMKRQGTKTAATYGWNRAFYPAKGYTVRTGTGWNNGTDPAAFEHHKADPSPCAFALDDGTGNDSSPWKREGDSGRCECRNAEFVAGCSPGKV